LFVFRSNKWTLVQFIIKPKVPGEPGRVKIRSKIKTLVS